MVLAFVCVLSQHPKRKDEQRESCLLPLLPAGQWGQAVTAPLIACWLLMFSERPALPALRSVACRSDVTRPRSTQRVKTYSQMCI